MMEDIWNLVNSEKVLTMITSNRFYLILLVIILIKMKNATYKNLWLCALINVPGTLLHEIMHLLVGWLMNAKPCNFTILPKRNPTGEYVMGSVGFRNIRFYNAIPAALAPLLLLPIGFYCNRYLLPIIPINIVTYVLYVLLQTIIIENSIPSRADFNVAKKFFWGIVLYGAMLAVILYRFFQDFNNFLSY